jgi:hypothetical protein
MGADERNSIVFLVIELTKITFPRVTRVPIYAIGTTHGAA